MRQYSARRLSEKRSLFGEKVYEVRACLERGIKDEEQAEFLLEWYRYHLQKMVGNAFHTSVPLRL